jgi:hypothetical protein
MEENSTGSASTWPGKNWRGISLYRVKVSTDASGTDSRGLLFWQSPEDRAGELFEARSELEEG